MSIYDNGDRDTFYYYLSEFLKEMDKRAISLLLHRWETPEVKEATF